MYEEAKRRLATGESFPKGVVDAIRISIQEDAREAGLRDDSRFGDRKKVALTGADGGAVKIEAKQEIRSLSTDELLAIAGLKAEE